MDDGEKRLIARWACEQGGLLFLNTGILGIFYLGMLVWSNTQGGTISDLNLLL